VGGTPNLFDAGRVQAQLPQSTGATMRWTKPEAEIVAVTMEVTAYVATL
jgi:coenzyme PQQ precursor peptide PqqA